MVPGQRQIELFIYRFLDWLTAAIAWFCFFTYRKNLEDPSLMIGDSFSDPRLWQGLVIIPIGWLILYAIFDKYSDIYRFSRWATLKRTFAISLIGVVLLFFTVLMDDDTFSYTAYINPFFRLFGLHFLFTAFVRMIYLTMCKKRLKAGQVKYNTLIIGGDKNAVALYNELQQKAYGKAHNFLGFLDSNGQSVNHMTKHIPLIGKLSDLSLIIEEMNVEEVIIAIETSEHDKLKSILDTLYDFSDRLLVKIIPDMYDIMLGNVKLTHIYGAILIEVDQEIMPRWEHMLKRLIDITASVIFMLILSPLYIYTAIRVKLSSEGPILYSQARIGKNSEEFQILKFRSMNNNAEKDGPQLSHDEDPRITKWGKVMRKWRLDEIPQMYNVLVGEMSLVGPRPERQFYIDQIMEKAPHYKHLLKIRPGITSWGQVKYGYASNLDQMLDRLKYDIIYLENMSIGLDIKILFYTVLVLFQGKGK